jgi:hypothetical protein
LVHVAMSEYYNRKKKKYLERENRKDKWEEALIAVLREVLPGQSPNLRTYFQCGQAGHFRREPPPVPCPICRGNHWKAHCPQFPGDTRPEPPTQWQVPGPPIQAPVTTLKAEEHWEILTIEKHKASLLTDTGASISAIPFSPGPRSSKKKNYCLEHIRPASRTLFHSASSLLLGRFPLMSLCYNYTKNPYSSARVRPSI